MDAPCKVQGNIHVLLCLIHKINVSRILGTYHIYAPLMMALFNISEKKMFPGTEMEPICIETVQSEHLAIIQALKNRDRQRIEQMIQKHFGTNE